MQYAFMKITEKYKCLIDANELLTLNSDITDFKESPLDDSNFIFKICYGFYYPQLDKKLNLESILNHIEDAKNKWLIHISKNHGTYLGINDLVLFPEYFKTRQKIPFAALVSVPPTFQLNIKGQAKTAFLKWHNLDIITNLINREGLFALVREEKRNTKNLTIENWKDKIDKERAIRNAFSIV